MTSLEIISMVFIYIAFFAFILLFNLKESKNQDKQKKINSALKILKTIEFDNNIKEIKIRISDTIKILE